MTSLFNYVLSLRFKLSLLLHLRKYPGSRYLNLKGTSQLSYSQYSQDLVLLPIVGLLLRQISSIQILDIGANHPIHFSNSFLIDSIFKNVQTVAIDPLQSMRDEWRVYRPSAIYLNCAVSNREGTAYMKIPKNKSNMFSTLVQDKDDSELHDFYFQDVPICTLTSAVDRYIRNEYILFIDVEGHEDLILKQIYHCNNKPILVLAENNSDGFLGSDHLRATMISTGYHYLGRLGPNDDLFIHTNYSECTSLRNIANT